MKTIRYESSPDGVVTLTFDDPDAPLNTMTPQWQADLTEAVDQLETGKGSLRGIVLASAKPTFFAGAELKGVLQLVAADAPACFATVEAVKRNFRRIETMGVPVVACLSGTALGGGWELALCAHHRVAVDDVAIRFGFPEVTLGLLPGASGVTKTVRLLGLVEALPYLVEGRLMRPREAQALGLVHAVVGRRDDLAVHALRWIGQNSKARQPWDEPDYRIPGGGPASPKVAPLLVTAPAVLRKKTRGLLPAPEAILACMVEGAEVDFDTALRIESRYLARLMVGQVTKNLVTLFFNRNSIRSGQSRPKGTPKWRATRVGILGAGMMGSGIASANAASGVPCVIKDISLEKAEAGKGLMAHRLDDAVARGKLVRARRDEILALVNPTASYDDLNGCDLIIEAVFENRELKAEVTRESCLRLADGGLFASNTSTLPITGLASACPTPERFIGLHFFSPVDRMELVEIIVGKKTDEQTLARAYDYVLQIGKSPIVVNDSRGFFTSRTFGTFVMEGLAMLAEGLPAAVIENAALAAGMPVGPLAVMDETSLALSMQVREQTAADFTAEGKTVPSHPGDVVLERMVRDFNRPGRAYGGGFYEYPEGGRKHLWDGLPKAFGKGGATFDMRELRDRFLYRQSIEAARCLEEGVLRSVHDGNVGSILGIGFPSWTGGALQFINSEGLERFVARAQELASRYGERFAAPAIVRQHLAQDELFR